MFRNIVLTFLFFISIHSVAQEFGGFKPTKQWSQLKRENYRLVFAPELKETARKVAAIFSSMKQLEVNIGAKRRNLNIILQNSVTRANGYVGLAPFVSEFFLTPYPVNNAIGTLPWHYTLGVHDYQFSAQNAVALPGLFKNDNLLIEAELRIEEGATNYRNSDQFVYSRGFLNVRPYEMYRFSGNYHFPIAYPDQGAFGIFYLLRIRANLFFDYTAANDVNREFNSAGAELILDTKLFRLFQLPFGMRYNYLLSQKKFENSTFEIFIPVSRF